MAEPSFSPIPMKEVGGAIAVNVFAVLSTAALFSVVLRIVWLAVRRAGNPAKPQEYVFFNTQLGHFAACLLVANLFNSTAGMISIPWIVNHGIDRGPICRMQAVIMQIGNWSLGYFTVSIAVHTFNSLVLKKRQSVLITSATITFGWAISILLAAVPAMLSFPDGPVYGADGFSCGVRAEFPKLQFLFHLLPIFIASMLSAILYSLIFLVLRGTLKIRGGFRLSFDPTERWSADDKNYHKFIARVATSMLWYPIAYFILLVPYSVMRLLDISGFFVPFEAMVFAYCCWFTLGVLNVLLLYNTFRVLGPAFDAQSSAAASRMGNESFGTTEQLQKADSFTERQRNDLEAKIKQYRFPVPTYRPQSEISVSNMSTQSGATQSSTRHLLAVHHEHSGSTASIDTSESSYGRPITPAAELNRLFDEDENRKSPRSSPTIDNSTRNARKGSDDSLPPPPRRTRSPINVMIQPRNPSPIQETPEGTFVMLSPAHVMTRQPSAQTFGGASQSPSSHTSRTGSDDLSATGWTPRQQIHRDSRNQDASGVPVLSAFAPAFPAQTQSSPLLGTRPLPKLPRQLNLLSQGGHIRSVSATSVSQPASTFSSPGRQRPLILSNQRSMDILSYYGQSRSSTQSFNP